MHFFASLGPTVDILYVSDRETSCRTMPGPIWPIFFLISHIFLFFKSQIMKSSENISHIVQGSMQWLIPVYFSTDVLTLREKCPYSELFWSAFPAFGLNTERYSVSLRIQSECRKMRTKITPNTDTFYAVLLLIGFIGF